MMMMMMMKDKVVPVLNQAPHHQSETCPYAYPSIKPSSRIHGLIKHYAVRTYWGVEI
jgi:hypothetical protein